MALNLPQGHQHPQCFHFKSTVCTVSSNAPCSNLYIHVCIIVLPCLSVHLASNYSSCRYTSSFQTKLDPTLIKSNPSSTNPTPSSSSNESTDYSSSGAASQGFSTSTNGTSGLSDASASSHAASPSARRRGTSSNR